MQPFLGQETSFYRAVAACLLAAGVFWQMNALNKTYTTRVSCPLVWRYDTSRVVPLRTLPAAVPVTVTGQGWRLLRANLGLGIFPAELRPVAVPGTRYLPPQAWQQALQTSLEGLQVNESAGDTLRLTFDRYATRRIVLALAPPLTTDSLHRFRAEFTPKWLAFRGPSSVVAQLPEPYLLALPEAELDAGNMLMLNVAVPRLVRPSASQVQARLVAVPHSSAHRKQGAPSSLR